MISPVALTTSRTALLFASPMNRSPAESTATMLGPFSSAAVAGPLSPAVTGFAVAGDGDDVAGRLDHLADHVVAGVGEEHVAGGVDGEAAGAVQLGGGRGPVVAAVTGGAVAGDGDDVAGRLDHLADSRCCSRRR